MNLKQSLKLLMVLVLASGLTLTTACGEPETGETTNQEEQENNETTNQTNNETENQPDNQSENQPDNQTNNETNNGDFELAEPTPTCDDDPRPAACDEDPDSVEFATASHVTMLGIADTDCCVDFTGDGDPNNVLPDVLGAAEVSRDETNASIQESIDDGSLNLVLEHAGLVEIEADAEFDINFLIAEEVTDQGATIDPASYDEGTHPHALIPDASLTEDGDNFMVEAGPGSMILSLNLGALTGGEIAIDLDLTISNATVMATLDGGQSTIDGGVVLADGQIGGLLLIEDLIAALNDFGSTCDCLDNPDAIAETSAAGIACALDEPDTSTCVDDQELCGTLADNCDLLSLVGFVADIDIDGDDQNEALSIGLEFETAATTIAGIGEGTAAE